eukprot:SAG31_NODE_18182_length_644_cov_1.040367_1_plen_42_part_10
MDFSWPGNRHSQAHVTPPVMFLRAAALCCILAAGTAAGTAAG